MPNNQSKTGFDDSGTFQIPDEYIWDASERFSFRTSGSDRFKIPPVLTQPMQKPEAALDLAKNGQEKLTLV